VKSRIISTVKVFRWQQWLVLAVFLLIVGFTAFNRAYVPTGTHEYKFVVNGVRTLDP
jgi:hypothetical protein